MKLNKRLINQKKKESKEIITDFIEEMTSKYIIRDKQKKKRIKEIIQPIWTKEEKKRLKKIKK